MEIKNLTFAYGRRPVLKELNLKFTPGKITSLLGSNGSGKTTLFQILSKGLKPKRGAVFYDKKNIHSIKPKEYAKQVAIVHQQNRVTGDMTVRQLVSFGRTPYMKMMSRYDNRDNEAIDNALEAMSLKELSSTPAVNLSGGQRQRVWIAMALAQETPWLLLDEPTTYLDIRYQYDILELIKKLNDQYDKTVVMILHDVNQAIDYSDEIVGLYQGKVLFQGEPEKVVTKEYMHTLFGVDLEVERYEDRPIVLHRRCLSEV